MNLLPLFEWLEATSLGNMVRQSLWLFPVIEAFHLVAFAVLGGTVLITDLRLLGFAMRSQPTAQIAREARPWLLGSLVVMIISGVLLFLSEAIKCYYSQAFWVKIITFVPALLFALTFRRRVIASAEGERSRATLVLTGATSMALWFTVAAAGRWIGFS